MNDAVVAACQHHEEFVALARSQPRNLNYLDHSVGSASHRNTELIKLKEKLSLTSVAKNGQPPGVVDLLSGQLHFALLAPQVGGPHIKTGKLRRPAAPRHYRRAGGGNSAGQMPPVRYCGP